MIDWYSDLYTGDAMEHILPQARYRDEDSLSLIAARQDSVYFHMQRRKWLVHFGGADRFEEFDNYAPAAALLAELQKGGPHV